MIDFVNCGSYEEMSQACAENMLMLVKSNPNASIILATGASPLLAYRIFVGAVLSKRVDVSRVTWIKLDEWAGLQPENPATCDFFIRREILSPLHISSERYIAFDQTADDLPGECRRIERLLSRLGSIDLAVVGVGRNGHIGLNEPTGALELGAHVAALDSKTKGHAMLAENGETATTRGLTFLTVFI